ncbi:MAG: class I SAM-dependent methyltransferase [Myxococcota bacterium]
MALGTFIASQLRKPTGWFGKIVVARVLNRANGPMNELTLRELELAPDDRVLEIGFGGGDLISRMVRVVTRGRIAGADFSPEMTAFCAKRFAALVRAGVVELRCASVDALPYPSGEFTKACAVNAIYFWPDPAAALCELRRVLRDGGRLAVTFNPRATAEKLPYTRHGFRHFEADEVRRLLEDSGFRGARTVEGSTGLGPFVCAIGVK